MSAHREQTWVDEPRDRSAKFRLKLNAIENAHAECEVAELPFFHCNWEKGRAGLRAVKPVRMAASLGGAVVPILLQ